MISLKQQGLLIPSVSTDKNGNGRLNGRVLTENSDFVRTLMSLILESNSVDDGPVVELWRSLQILEITGVRSKALDKATTALLLQNLQRDEVPVPSILGVLLSIRRNEEETDGTSEVLHLISSQITGLLSDVGFLSGLERFLSQLEYLPALLTD
jgi:hypothetical protein